MPSHKLNTNMVRVRFAPSPTGFLHVGNVRTALFNWLFARKNRGTFILRIEDTDLERSLLIYEKQLIHDLKWLGLNWDEGIDVGGTYGPYRQTDRYETYRSSALRLLEEGSAYYCFCSEEELELQRQAQLAREEVPKYSGKCRNITLQDAKARISRGERAVVRLKVREGEVGFDDMVFGEIKVDCSIISDPILLRSDATPNYNFSCVIDDHLMKISHVIRGEGHISNTHRQVLIYEALRVNAPKFAHLSTVLGQDGMKLSKRHGATSVEEFRRQGYLPEALVNYLTLLGWAPREQGAEILSIQELVEQFELERVNKTPAIFDLDKLNWINRHYIKAAELGRLVELSEEYFVAAGLLPEKIDTDTADWLGMVVNAVRPYLDHLDEVVEKSKIVFDFDAKNIIKSPDAADVLDSQTAKEVIQAFYDEIKDLETLTTEQYKASILKVKERTKQKGKNLFHPIRVGLTASGSGPELDKLIPIYERGKTLNLPVKVKGCKERLEEVLKLLYPMADSS